MSWKKAKISEICCGIYDGPHATPPVSDDGAIFLGISNITPDGHLDLSDPKYISENDFPKWTKRVTPQAGDIVFSYEATLNLYAIIPVGFRGCLGRRMALIRPYEEKVLGKFLYYYFFSDEWRGTIAENTVIGATVDRIPLIRFPEFPVSFPSIEKQRIIADILSAYDGLIENNQQQIKLLEEAAQRLYKEWFVDLRFPGHETTPIVDGVPEGWKQDTINSIIELQSGFAFKSADFCDSGTYKIVTIKNVQDGLFDGKNVSKINDIPARMPPHCRLNDGDILLSLTGNVGRVCVVNGQDYLLNQRVAKIKSDYPVYAYCLFRSSDMFTSMGNLANGAAQQNLSPIKTGQIKTLIPSVSLLIRFEVTASAYLKQMLNLNKQIELFQQARDRLLPKLMNGEIEV